jgi:hypothetical protein
VWKRAPPWVRYSSVVRVGLVGCVKKKATSAMPAADLYISPLFLKERRVVERSCDRWYILSAKHGLVRPTEIIHPYSQTLSGAPAPSKARWSQSVLAALTTDLDGLEGKHFEIHAGMNYWTFGLVDGLLAAGASVDVPTAGMPIGKKLQYYTSSRFGAGPATEPPWRPAPRLPTSIAPLPTAGALPSKASGQREPERVGEEEPKPLTRWLLGASSPVTLRFADIERIIGRQLPPSARNYAAYWANSKGHALPDQWLAAGWHAEKVDRANEWVRLPK